MVPLSHKLQAESVWLFGEQFTDLAVIYVSVVWKKNYKFIRRISQVKRTKAASQYAVAFDFETGFFQTIHLPESPGTTMSDPV